ncbi:uncharacterized protein LOC111268977 [Varroa jacobsoni]|uniref:uncharacterized protein LOC111268977 n=1 Tax=Varroa jacobsoni TaxID=62625 RepID=UPI000BF9FEF8|nr:uncharacterized protein LOC111268977 [Varroa jacobsoni]
MREIRLTPKEKLEICSSVGVKFGEVLWTRLRDVIEKSGTDWVTPDEYVAYFNQENKRLNYRNLDTNNVPLMKYFTALDNIFHVKIVQFPDSSEVRLYLVPDFHTRTARTWIPKKSDSQSKALPDLNGQPFLKNPNTKSHGQRLVPIRKIYQDTALKNVVREFNVGLGFQGTISCQDYLQQLDEKYPGVKGAMELRSAIADLDLIDNYVISVADAKCPVVRISTELLRVGHPTIAPTYVEKYPYCTVFPEPNERRPQQPSDEKVFIAEVNEIDIVPRHMRMFITIIDRIGERDRLQKKLQSTYGRNKNQTIPLNQLRKGLPCAVPFEGTQDFHRAVILRPVVSRLVQVLYVDFGTVADVVSESLIFLDEDFYKVPVLAEPAVLSFAVPWKDRRGVADKILKQSSVKMIVLGWSEEQNSIIVQVSDLASYPMKLRSELRAA